MASKIKEQMELEGEAVVELIDAASQVHAPAGTGRLIDDVA